MKKTIETAKTVTTTPCFRIVPNGNWGELIVESCDSVEDKNNVYFKTYAECLVWLVERGYKSVTIATRGTEPYEMDLSGLEVLNKRILRDYDKVDELSYNELAERVRYFTKKGDDMFYEGNNEASIYYVMVASKFLDAMKDNCIHMSF